MTARPPIDEAEARYQECLELWRRWMRGGRVSAGYRAIDSVCGRSASNLMAGEGDPEIVYDKLDRKIAETVNACVESLMPAERLAIYIDNDLARVWPFKRIERSTCLAMATVTLKRLIAKRC